MSHTQYNIRAFDSAPNLENGQVRADDQFGRYSLQYEKSEQFQNSQYSETLSSTMHRGPNKLDKKDFLKFVSSVRIQMGAVASSIVQISSLHHRVLDSSDSSSPSRLEDVVSQLQTKNREIRDSIKYLEQDMRNDQDLKGMKTKHIQQLKAEFEENLQKFKNEEVLFKQKYREQIARQFRIVNPEATEDQVREATEREWGSDGVFQTALNSSRLNQASTTLGSVRARRNDIRQIEKTVSELEAMFREMAEVVDSQEDYVRKGEQNAEHTKDDTKRADSQLSNGVDKIRSRNKLRRWCILISLIIILVIALGIGLGLGLNASRKSSN